MTMTDPISDLLTRIRNGQMVRKPKIACPASKIKAAILKVLQEGGYYEKAMDILKTDLEPLRLLSSLNNYFIFQKV